MAYEKDAIDKTIIAVLDTVGLQMWRDKQKECIHSFVLGRDTFVVLPTGYGKSLIFGCLPSVYDILRGVVESQDGSLCCADGTFLLGEPGSIVVCVSPLISLMMDQKSKFVPRGIECDFIGDSQCD